MESAVPDLVAQDEAVTIGLRDLPPADQDAAGRGGEGRHVGGTTGWHCSRESGSKGENSHVDL